MRSSAAVEKQSHNRRCRFSRRAGARQTQHRSRRKPTQIPMIDGRVMAITMIIDTVRCVCLVHWRSGFLPFLFQIRLPEFPADRCTVYR